MIRRRLKMKHIQIVVVLIHIKLSHDFQGALAKSGFAVMDIEHFVPWVGNELTFCQFMVGIETDLLEQVDGDSESTFFELFGRVSETFEAGTGDQFFRRQ